MSRFPSVYQPASLRCVTPCDGEHIGVGFDGDNGKTVRLRLSKQDAVQLADLIREQSDLSKRLVIRDGDDVRLNQSR